MFLCVEPPRKTENAPVINWTPAEPFIPKLVAVTRGVLGTGIPETGIMTARPFTVNVTSCADKGAVNVTVSPDTSTLPAETVTL